MVVNAACCPVDQCTRFNVDNNIAGIVTISWPLIQNNQILCCQINERLPICSTRRRIDRNKGKICQLVWHRDDRSWIYPFWPPSVACQHLPRRAVVKLTTWVVQVESRCPNGSIVQTSTVNVEWSCCRVLDMHFVQKDLILSKHFVGCLDLLRYWNMNGCRYVILW
jgi:hypothetical protein